MAEHPKRLIFPLCFFSGVLLIALWLLLAVELPSHSKVVFELLNAGHAFIFCFITLGFALAWRSFYPKLSTLIVVVVACGVGTVLGAISEYIQPFFGRGSSWSDLFTDVLGVVAGASLYLALVNKGLYRWGFVVFAALVFLYAFTSPLTWFYAKHVRDKHFPVIGDFESAWSSRFFKGSYYATYSVTQAPPDWRGNTTQVAKVDFLGGRWPGLQAFDLRGRWGDYNDLSFDVFNPQETDLRLVVRINDAEHNNEYKDRYNKTFTIEAGAKRISIPLAKIEQTRSGRKLNLSKIRLMMLYMHKPQQPHTLYFDNFRLE